MEYAGKAVYKIAATTKDDKKNNISFHETGFARYYTEKQLQIEAGKLSKDNEITMSTVVYHGDYTVNADNGKLRLKAKSFNGSSF